MRNGRSRLWRWLLGGGLALLVLFSSRARSPGTETEAFLPAAGAEDPLTGAVLVDLVDDASASDRAAIAGALVRAIAPFDWPADPTAALGEPLSRSAQLFRLTPPASELGDIFAALEADPRVEGLELERTWSLPAHTSERVSVGAPPAVSDDEGFVPNDPYYPYQWHLDQIGMRRAWTLGRGRGAIVAVLDTGVAHRDEGGYALAPDLGETRFVPGYDFVHGDANADDEHGHGTHVAGTIAQSTNNGVGVAGVAPEASIMPLQVLDRNGSGGWGAIAAAIRYAADHDANVINLSLGGGFPSRTVQRAIDYAHRKGVLVVAAAGNSGRSRVEYPSRHNHVLSVGAVRYDRTLSFYSNYGTGLDLVAPGGDLRVDQNEDGMPDGVVQNTIVSGQVDTFDYLAWQGTSMASPHVAGVAALIYGAGVTDPDAVAQILQSSATDLGDAHRYGSGLVRADHALQAATRDRAGARASLALLFGGLLLFGLRRRGRLAIPVASTLLVAALAAGGLGLLPLDAGLAGLLALGPLGAMSAALGAGAAPLVLSALPIFALVALTLHLKRFSPVLVGLAIGSAGFFAVEALWPTLAVGLLPGALVGPWLIVQAALALGLAHLVARRA